MGLFQSRLNQKLMARYFTFKDWRDRGLIARPSAEMESNYKHNPLKAYPNGKFVAPGFAAKARFYADDLMAVVDDDETAKALYTSGWFGL